MPEPDPKKTIAFASPKDLAEWLKRNHAKEQELWVKIFKKASGIPSVTWGEIAIETLCWGWIDGVKKSLGEEAYLQRITPRKPRSGWSKRNTEQVEKLIREGRMEKPGLAQVDAAKADGRWENAYAPASEMEIPDDFIAAVKKKPKAQTTFEDLNKTNRYAIAYGLTTAKRPETRERRFEKFLGMLTRGEKPDFGFKKK
ncbi:MAG: YdeI/OmpD-associated family protein [Planctomycetota bacterium]